MFGKTTATTKNSKKSGENKAMKKLHSTNNSTEKLHLDTVAAIPKDGSESSISDEYYLRTAITMIVKSNVDHQMREENKVVMGAILSAEDYLKSLMADEELYEYAETLKRGNPKFDGKELYEIQNDYSIDYLKCLRMAVCKFTAFLSTKPTLKDWFPNNTMTVNYDFDPDIVINPDDVLKILKYPYTKDATQFGNREDCGHADEHERCGHNKKGERLEAMKFPDVRKHRIDSAVVAESVIYGEVLKYYYMDKEKENNVASSSAQSPGKSDLLLDAVLPTPATTITPTQIEEKQCLDNFNRKNKSCNYNSQMQKKRSTTNPSNGVFGKATVFDGSLFDLD